MDGDNLLVSERFAEAFQRDGLTGLSEFDPVEILRVRPYRLAPLVPRYLFARVARSDVAVDDQASGIVRRKPVTCTWCRDAGVDVLERVVLETEPPEDVLYARGLTGDCLVTERFRRFCERQRFTNVHLIPSDHFGFNYLGPPPATRFHPDFVITPGRE